MWWICQYEKGLLLTSNAVLSQVKTRARGYTKHLNRAVKSAEKDMAQIEKYDKKRLQRDVGSKTVLKMRAKQLCVPLNKVYIHRCVAIRQAAARKNAAQKKRFSRRLKS